MKTAQLQPADLKLASWLLNEDSYVHGLAHGAEGGFNERADVIVAADGTDLNDFWSEIQATIRLRNEDKTSIIDALSVNVDGVTEEITTPSEVDFEEASEYGQPEGIRGTAARFWRGFDFKFYDLGVRYTWMAIAEMTRQQLQLHHNMALEADTKLRFRTVMKRLFNPLNGNGITEKNEPVTVFGFYNGDGEVPPKYKHDTFAGNHNHYLVSGAAAVRPQDLDRLAREIEEHGYTIQLGYNLILWVNKVEAAEIRKFKVDNGAQFDFVPNQALFNGAIWVPNNGSYVGGPEGTVKGQIGTYGPFRIVEEGYIPAGYIVAIATGGAQNLSNPIGIREHSNPAYRGLKVIPGQRSQYPLVDSFYRRGLGSGIRHRGAGAIMQIKASGTYQVPAQYDTV